MGLRERSRVTKRPTVFSGVPIGRRGSIPKWIRCSGHLSHNRHYSSKKSGFPISRKSDVRYNAAGDGRGLPTKITALRRIFPRVDRIRPVQFQPGDHAEALLARTHELAGDTRHVDDRDLHRGCPHPRRPLAGPAIAGRKTIPPATRVAPSAAELRLFGGG